MEDKNLQTPQKVTPENKQKTIWKDIGILALSLALAILTIITLNV